MITIIDKSKGWFGIENEFVDKYMKHIHPIASCIYITLKRFASNKDTCFPSQQTIADKINVKRQTVNKYVKELVEKGFVEITEEINNKGKMYIYTLLPLSKVLTGGCQQNRQGVVNNIDTNNTYIKKSNISKDILSQDKSCDKDTFVFKETLNRLLNSKTEYVTIIANYWKHKGISFPNQKAYQISYKRNVIPAKALVGYTDKDLWDTFEYLDKQDFKWTLETVLKYVPEIKKLKK